MKIDFEENKWGTYIRFVPETSKETAQLLRFTKSSKRQVPNVSFSFSQEEPSCSVKFDKVQTEKQNNFFRNGE